MKIDWELDQDSRTDLSSDLVADIFITEGNSSIVERKAYLDSWLEELIKGLNELTEAHELALDLIEEPDPLILRSSGNEVWISYKDMCLSTTMGEFRSALTTAARRFAAEVSNTPKRPISNELPVLIQTLLSNS